MTRINEPAVFGLTPEERSAIETFYSAFEGNPDVLDGVVTSDWQDIPLAPGQQPGCEGLKPLIAGFKACFPDVKITIHEIVGAQGRAAVRATLSGTHLGEWFGVAPTGRSFAIAIHEFHHLVNGRLTHTWHLEDWFGWFAQVGASPVGNGEAAE
jgi:predicted ester cyclase